MVDAVTSRLVASVEAVWGAIQRRHPEVPPVVVTVASGGPQGRVLGHFAPVRWRVRESSVHELFVGGEGLEEGAVSVLDTLLHEAAHALGFARGVKDTSRDGRYHNKRFRELAEELGLSVSRDGDIGWSLTTVPEATAREYAAEVERLGEAIVHYRVREGVLASPGGAGGGDGRAPKNGLVLVCRCDPPRKLRMARGTAALGSVVCGVCYGPFEEAC